MSKLMPQAVKRRCPSCGFAWTTAYTGATQCSNPACGQTLVDCSAGWPHVCSQGHSHPHGGKCPTCPRNDA